MNAVVVEPQYYPREDNNNELLMIVIEKFKKFFFFPRLPDFELIAKNVVNYIYRIYQAPDKRSCELLRSLCQRIMELSNKRKAKLRDIEENGVESSQPTKLYIANYLLPRIVFFFGAVASKELFYLDVDIYNNMKYREDLKREKNDKNKSISRKSTNMNASATEAMKRLNTTANEKDEEEMMVGATAEDGLAEMILQICENELVSSRQGILSQLEPILVEILNHPARYHDDYMQRAAVMALMRLMVVSSKFCSERIPFLMNILKKTTSAYMKRNIITGLSDFTCRFPNVIEPWTSNLYATLLEIDVSVRLTAVKTLSYLILQEMIRVRGQLSDMAICIVDENDEISSTTKEFFREIAHKQNILYNVLPDIISRLSSDTPVEEEKFRTIMKHIMDLIQKDRQVESLVEKLCYRFKITNLERQWRDVAYCLSLLNHSEKTIKKLIEYMPNYRDKIQYDEVYECFKAIITNANKQTTKVELKNAAKEFDTKLQECMEVQENGVGAANPSTQDENQSDSDRIAEMAASQQKKRQNKRGVGKSMKNKRQNRLAARMISDDEDDDDDDFTENSPPPKGKGRGKRGQRVQSESDDSSEEDQPVRGRRQRK